MEIIACYLNRPQPWISLRATPQTPYGYQVVFTAAKNRASIYFIDPIDPAGYVLPSSHIKLIGVIPIDGDWIAVVEEIVADPALFLLPYRLGITT